MINSALLTSAIIVSLAALPAVGQADNDTGAYVGLSTSWISADFSNRLDINFNDSDAAFEIRAGYMFTDNFGIETGYLDLGDFSAEGNNRIELDADAFSLAAVGNYPLDDKVDAYAKIGVYRVEANRHSTIEGAVLRENEKDTSLFVAAGFEYDLGNWNLLFQYAVADTDAHRLKLDLMSLGAKYEFGTL